MISASHNPFEDNGIKFFSRDGHKLPEATERQIEALVETGEIDHIRPRAREIGKAYRIGDAIGRYIESVKSTVPKGMTLRGLRVVADCANGAAYRTTPTVLRELGAEVIALYVEPNGININLGCGSLHPEGLREAVLRHGADVGLAHDGDADRVIFVDERGGLVDGDRMLALCGLDMDREGRLHGRTVVATVMSNAGLDACLAEAGIRVVRTPVGDRHVQEVMTRHGYSLGGEQSGHLLFMEHSTTEDGLITALQILAVMRKQGKPLSELAACMVPLPQVLLNVRVRRKEPFAELAQVARRIREAEEALGARGRVLVRYSGTEPLARVMVEGVDEGLIGRLAREIAAAVAEAVGAGEAGAEGA